LGDVVRGRERKAVEVFNEALQYYGGLQEDGKVEGVEAWFLAPHGGDLAGFILLRGEREQLDEIQCSAEFERLQTRASLIVDRSECRPTRMRSFARRLVRPRRPR
jgi:hypothetical protein